MKAWIQKRTNTSYLVFESASMISVPIPPSSRPDETVSILFLLYLYSNVTLVPLSLTSRLFRVTHSSSSVCPANDFLPKQTYLPSPSPVLPTSLSLPFFPPAAPHPTPTSTPLPHTAPASLPLSAPSPNVTVPLPSNPPLLFSPSLA